MYTTSNIARASVYMDTMMPYRRFYDFHPGSANGDTYRLELQTGGRRRTGAPFKGSGRAPWKMFLKLFWNGATVIELDILKRYSRKRGGLVNGIYAISWICLKPGPHQQQLSKQLATLLTVASTLLPLLATVSKQRSPSSKRRSTLSKGRNFNAKLVRHCGRFSGNEVECCFDIVDGVDGVLVITAT